MRDLSLHKIERQSWRTTMQGGLIEILFAGMMFAGAASYLVSDLGVPSAACTATLVVLHVAALLLMLRMRKRYILPRVGRAVFGRSRKRRLRWMSAFLAICVLATIALVVLTVLAQRTDVSLLGPIGAAPIVAIVAVVVLVPLGVLAIVLDYPRFLLLGGLIVVAEAVIALFERYGAPPHDRTLVYGTIGVVSLTIGLIAFRRFIRRVPRFELEEAIHGG